MKRWAGEKPPYRGWAAGRHLQIWRDGQEGDSYMKSWAGVRPPYEMVSRREISLWRGGHQKDIFIKRWEGGRPPYEMVGSREASTWKGGQEEVFHIKRWAKGRHPYEELGRRSHPKKEACRRNISKILHMKGWEGLKPPYEEVGSFEEVGRSNTSAMRTEITTWTAVYLSLTLIYQRIPVCSVLLPFPSVKLAFILWIK